MPISTTVERFLATHDVSYEVIEHPHTNTSVETADSAYIWQDQLAKSVLLEDDEGRFTMAVVPASHRVDLGKLEHALRRTLRLATEPELEGLFPDCELGALPPLGVAYGIPTIYDDRLRRLSCVYLEAGDHRELIYMGGREFIDLLADAPHADLCTES